MYLLVYSQIDLLCTNKDYYYFTHLHVTQKVNKLFQISYQVTTPRPSRFDQSSFSSTLYRTVTQPRLHNIIATDNIHGPCGALNPESVCMKDGKCYKYFPKEHIFLKGFIHCDLYLNT